jgi:hypothetical protein
MSPLRADLGDGPAVAVLAEQTGIHADTLAKLIWSLQQLATPAR